MKNIFQLFIRILPAIFLCSCISEYRYFEHLQTKDLLGNVSVEDFRKPSSFVDRGILFVPYFRTLTDSFAEPKSYFRFYSLSDSKLFISKAVLAAGSGSFEYEMPVDRLVVLSRLDESDGYLSGGLKLFDISSVDLTKVLNENVIICTLFYKINDVDGAISFELQQKSSNEIDWGT